MPLINPHNILTPYDIKRNKMSEIKYGLISKTDARTLEKTIDLIEKDYVNGFINILEIGNYAGETANGLREYSKLVGLEAVLTGIDNNRDNEPLRFPYDKIITGNSSEVYGQIPDESQHLVVVDANHSFPYVVSDYYCYAPKVKPGGYLCFHDAAPQAQGRGWQLMGDRNDPDMSIAVMKALERIGLLDKHLAEVLGWEKIFHEWDENDEHGGMIVFKKIN